MHTTTVNAAQSALLSKFAKVRAQSFALNTELGAEFAREAGREWKDRGFSGLASACYNVSQSCREIVGGYTVFEAARDLAVALAAEVVR